MIRAFYASRRSYLTYAIILANVCFYIYTSIIGGDFIVTGQEPVSMFGQVNYYVLYRGWYWQLFTSIFVHANIVHLVGNMFFFLIFGLRAEEIFSTKEYLLIYFLSGLAGNLLSLLLGPFAASVGASGAIFGIFGACTVYVRRSIGQSIISALVYASFFLVLSAGPNVNNLAHLGGLAVGLLIGYILASKRRSQLEYRFSYGYSKNWP